jgi:hypothetical protein
MKTNELNRREFIARAAKSYLGVGLMPLVGSYIHDNAYALTPGTRPARARYVIYLNMAGAMSHLDTFDPKPQSPDVQGPVEAIQTSADDIFLSENLPTVAKHMHNAAIVRSVTSNQGAHEQASYLMHTSYQKRGTIVHPTFGSWVSKLSGSINRTIPANVKIGGGGGGAGFLESRYGALPLRNAKAGLANSSMADYLDSAQFNNRIKTAEQLNAVFSEEYNQKQIRAYTDLYKDAVKLMQSEDLKAFDISDEPEAMTELYGESNFGQGCLLARRLIENKVRYVEVTRGGWDTHDNNFDRVAANCADVDKALGALLFDLEIRGLLNETLVVLTSEFGRTPKINPRDGRDHWPKAFSAFFAGGAIKGGTIYGQSDDKGMEVEHNPVKPEDLNATIAYALGLSLNDVHYSPSGRPFQIAHKGQPILDILS